jgi:hypothetical protein
MTEAIDAIPFTEADRREAERMLRALARGAPIDRVEAGTLPELRSVSPLSTHEGADALAVTRPRQLLRKRMAVASLAALPALAVGLWAWRSAPSSGAPPAVVASAAPTVAMATDSVAPTAAGAEPRSRAARPTTAPPVVRRGDITRAAPAPATDALAAAPAGTNGEAREARDTAHAERAPERAPAGKVRIRAFPPEATIAIDGRELGTGVVLDSVIAAGRRRLRVSSPGYIALDTTIVVVAGETVQLTRLTLRPVETP